MKSEWVISSLLILCFFGAGGFVGRQLSDVAPPENYQSAGVLSSEIGSAMERSRARINAERTADKFPELVETDFASAIAAYRLDSSLRRELFKYLGIKKNEEDEGFEKSSIQHVAATIISNGAIDPKIASEAVFAMLRQDYYTAAMLIEDGWTDTAIRLIRFTEKGSTEADLSKAREALRGKVLQEAEAIIMKAWATNDPGGAWEDAVDKSSNLQRIVIQSAFESNPEKAVEMVFADDFQFTKENDQAGSIIMSKLVENDPEIAFDWLQRHKDMENAAGLSLSFFSQLGSSDDTLEFGIAAIDSGLHLEFPGAKGALTQFAAELARSDPEKAAKWARGFKGSGQGLVLDRVADNLPSPELRQAFIEKIEVTEKERARMIRQYGVEERNPSQVPVATSEPDPMLAAENLVRTEPEKALHMMKEIIHDPDNASLVIGDEALAVLIYQVPGQLVRAFPLDERIQTHIREDQEWRAFLKNYRVKE